MNIGDYEVRLADLAIGGLVSLLGWLLVEVRRMRESLRELRQDWFGVEGKGGVKSTVANLVEKGKEIDGLRQELIGIDGTNGLKGSMGKLAARVDGLDECIATQENDAGRLSERMRAAERDIGQLKGATA